MTQKNSFICSLNAILPSNYDISGDPSVCFRLCIQRFLDTVDEGSELVGSIDGVEVYDAYVRCCLSLLTQIALSKELGSADGTPVFSIFQMQQLSKCMQFIVCLGIYPLLSPGVSVPLSLRMENSEKFRFPNAIVTSSKYERLFEFVRCFEAIRNSTTAELQDLLRPDSFLGDFISVLMELAYAPPPAVGLGKISIELSGDARRRLLRLLVSLPRAIAFRELLFFQSGFSQAKTAAGVVNVRAPKWLRIACGRLITQLLMTKSRSNAAPPSTNVQDLLLAVLDVIGGPHASKEPRHISVITTSLAHILSIPPSPPKSSSEGWVRRYYCYLAPQIQHILDLSETIRSTNGGSDRVLVARIGHSLAINTIHEICKKDITMGNEFFLQPQLMHLGRLLKCTLEEENVQSVNNSVLDASEVCELLSSNELNRQLNFFSELLGVVHPSVALVRVLIAHSQLWFHFLADLISLGESLLVDTTDKLRLQLETILHSMLKACGPEESAFMILRQWLGLPSVNETEFVTCSPSPYLPLPLRPGLVFRPILLSEGHTTSEDFGSVFFRVRLMADRKAVSTGSQLRQICGYVAAAMRIIGLFRPAISSETLDPNQHVEKSANEETCDVIEDEGIPKHLFSWSSDSGAMNNPANLASAIFISLISDINAGVADLVHTSSSNRDGIVLPTAFSSEACQQLQTRNTATLTASLLASAMLQQLNADFLWPKDTQMAVKIFSLSLSRICLVLSSCTDETVVRMQEDSLGHLLGMLAFYVNYMQTGDTVPSTARNAFSQLIPLLEQVENVLSVDANASRDLAHHLRLSLCTRGAIRVVRESAPVQTTPVLPELNLLAQIPMPSTRRLIEEVDPDHQFSTAKCMNRQSNEEIRPDAEMDQRLVDSLKLLRDPLVPVRGHGLIEIGRMLEERDPIIKGFECQIYGVLVENLTDDDSYIYLNAIRGLSALGIMFTDRLLPLLLRHFTARAADGSHSKTIGPRIEFRLKVGEAIVRILRNLGEMAARYRDLVLADLLRAAVDPDELIRAASLSNIAEISQLLRHAIKPAIYEILITIEDHLYRDSSPSVRKSAAFLARSLFVTSGRTGLPPWLPGDVLRDLHRLLVSYLRIERDRNVLEQIEAALSELDRRTEASLFIPPDSVASLVKEIRVLRPFDD